MTLTLGDIVNRAPPSPWTPGATIPWSEPGFSARMLSEHLSQAHDAASRRLPIIDQQVTWIHSAMLGNKTARVLDLGCGPGLYAERLARLGHSVRGIDFSPASIDYARAQAADELLACDYTLADLRAAEFGSGYDLAMLIYGEANVFTPDELVALLRKMRAALAPDGRLLLEVSTESGVRALGAQPPRWWSAERGLFGEQPHVGLFEAAWSEAHMASAERWFIIDARTSAVARYGSTTQAYRDEGYCALLVASGFGQVEIMPRFGAAEPHEGFQVVTAHASPR
jgi:SAM-dependent methyltransferase